MHDDVWRRAGLRRVPAHDLAPGESDEASVAAVRELFADVLDGHEVLANNSRWLSFTTVRNERWLHGNVVLLGDAAHTAHFSIGSGTKLAMEDALALAACLHEYARPAGRRSRRTSRSARPWSISTQRAAQASLEWFENLGLYTDQAPDAVRLQPPHPQPPRSPTTTCGCATRSSSPGWTTWFADAAGGRARHRGGVPADVPRRSGSGELDLANRVVVSPMDMYVAQDGMPGDFHLVHLGGKALGGAGLVMTEMVCVSPRGRITPGCAGLWTDEQGAAWRRVCRLRARVSRDARIGIQLGHSGPKGSTKLMWEGMDQPLPEGNWPLVVGLRAAVRDGVTRPRASSTAPDMDAVVARLRRAPPGARPRPASTCWSSTARTATCCPASSPRSPTAAPTTTAARSPTGCASRSRCSTPCARSGPPSDPMTVRISATDWAEGGIDAEDAVEVARAFAEHGADAIDVSTGQVVARRAAGVRAVLPDAVRRRDPQQPATPDIAVGVISSATTSTRSCWPAAPTCALGRAHLYDPNWTLHAAAEQDYDGPGVPWPMPWLPGRRKPQTGRSDGPKPRLELIRSQGASDGHQRWRPTVTNT